MATTSSILPQADQRARSLYVAFDVFPRPKGSTSHIASMVAALARDFAPVCVLCLGDETLPVHEHRGSIAIYRLPGEHRNVLQRATAFAQFVAYHAKRHAPTMELMVFRDPWGGVPALRAAPTCPSIFEVNALPSWELAYSRPGFAESATLPAKLGDMERECLRTVDGVLCVSAVTQRTLVHGGVDASKIAVIPNSASDAFFRGAEHACVIPQLLAGEWCGYVGSLQQWQGVEFLIDAFALTSTGNLLIVHSGSVDTSELERRIAWRGLADRVLLHGPLATNDLAGVFARLRFTVAPLTETARNTQQGCCPVKVVESMAAGTPAIASDLFVSRELIDHDVNGCLAPVGDRRAWALAIEQLFQDRALRARLSAGAVHTAKARFAQPIVHEQLDSVFLRVAATQPTGTMA